MAITTLLGFWTSQKTVTDAAVAAALSALSAAQTTLAASRAALAAANETLAGLVRETAEIRADLAEAATPADVDALTPRLARAIRDTRAQQAVILAAEDAIDAAQTGLDLATADAEAASARAAAVAAALDAADQDKDRAKVAAGQAVRAANSVTIAGLVDHPFLAADAITVSGMTDASFNGSFTIASVTPASITYPQTAADATSGGGVVFGARALRLRHSLTLAPLKTMVVDATAALSAKPWTDAVARLAADFPAELRACADERAAVETSAVNNENAVNTAAATLREAALTAAEKNRELFDAADAAFRDYVVGAKNRLDQALAVAARVADVTRNPLTAAENASIHSRKPDGTTDAALQSARNAAAAARQAVATAQIDVDARQTDVDIARLEARAANVDADPDTDPAVVTAQGLLNTAKGTLAGKTAAFTAAMQDALDAWETAVPDTAWRNLADLEDASRLLVALQANPGPLVTALDTAEATLVASLIAADKTERTRAFVEREAIQASSRLRFDRGSLPRRELGALRGDS